MKHRSLNCSWKLGQRQSIVTGEMQRSGRGQRIHQRQRGKHGNTGEPNVSTRSSGKGHPHEKATRMNRAPVTPDLSGRRRDRRKWYPKGGKRSEGEGRRQS
ncbi:MAG: hypothetical protein AB2L20_19905 [Mangrovibacterium sp.]